MSKVRAISANGSYQMAHNLDDLHERWSLRMAESGSRVSSIFEGHSDKIEIPETYGDTSRTRDFVSSELLWLAELKQNRNIVDGEGRRLNRKDFSKYINLYNGRKSYLGQVWNRINVIRATHNDGVKTSFEDNDHLLILSELYEVFWGLTKTLSIKLSETEIKTILRAKKHLEKTGYIER